MKTTKSMERSKNLVTTNVDVNTEIAKVSVTAIAVTAGVIGCWATVSLLAGLVGSGGPVGLIQNFIAAVTG